MSSAQGFPDWQRITQWLGPPIDQQTELVIGAGAHAAGPFQVSNFASVLVALKATGGPVTVTIKQTVPSGPASLVLSESVVVAAGATLFEAFVLFAGAVELDLQGSVAGTSVDYALYGSNTTTNAQVITAATINVQHNEALVAAEGTLDFVDAAGFVWSIADDGPGTRVKVAAPVLAGVVLAAAKKTAPVSTAGLTFATGADILAAALNFTADGVSSYFVTCSAADISNNAAAGRADLMINLDGADAGTIADQYNGAVANAGPPLGVRGLITPAAGAHTVNVRLRAITGGTASLDAGPGGAGAVTPAVVTVEKAF